MRVCKDIISKRKDGIMQQVARKDADTKKTVHNRMEWSGIAHCKKISSLRMHLSILK